MVLKIPAKEVAIQEVKGICSLCSNFDTSKDWCPYCLLNISRIENDREAAHEKRTALSPDNFHGRRL
jgi:hypothetical protein